jgi:hypothetical protein
LPLRPVRADGNRVYWHGQLSINPRCDHVSMDGKLTLFRINYAPARVPIAKIFG